MADADEEKARGGAAGGAPVEPDPVAGAATEGADRAGAGAAGPDGPGGAEAPPVEPPPVTDGPAVPLTADDGPEAVDEGPTVRLPAGGAAVDDPAVDGAAVPDGRRVSPFRRALSRVTAANAMIAVLLALLGFTLVVQVRTNSTDASLASARQEDLVRILSDLEAQEERVRQDIAVLEESQRQLNSGAEGRQAALEEAARRADELGILAGTLPARGPGLAVTFSGATKPVAASRVLDAVQELRGAGAEAMQISGGDGATVRIIASTYFLDADGGISVGGRRLTGPYRISVIGDPKTMQTALNIPGGVVASVSGDGGNVAIEEREVVDVTALSPPKELQHARPVS
ncbi:DUF881 domain-containing protein [Plantactinospora sp. WMMB334]|uniref:DUF881 domain-containing protein n=1 Tax=Plantactinospora sp. WMMB334 TaxID=3404119 RepID=UPI003B926D03